MKRLIYLLFSLGSILYRPAASAQSFVPASGNADTVSDFPHDLSNSMNVENPLHSSSASGVTIKWTIQAVGLATGVSMGFCDNQVCRYNLTAGNNYISAPYTTPDLFHAVFNGMNGAPAGSVSYVTVLAEDTVIHYSRTLTFRAYKPALGVNGINAKDDGVLVYPNPAGETINVWYSALANVKTVAIYDVTGKALKVYHPGPDNITTINVGDLGAGIYFIRVLDTNGYVVGARQFARQ